MLGVERREYRLVLALLVSVFHLILLQAVRPYKDETTLWLAVCTSATMGYTLIAATILVVAEKVGEEGLGFDPTYRVRATHSAQTPAHSVHSAPLKPLPCVLQVSHGRVQL